MNNYKDGIVEALKLKLEGEIAAHKVNINIMMSSHVGVAEHPDLIATIDGELEKLATAADKLNTLELI
jgi:hypothetical protein